MTDFPPPTASTQDGSYPRPQLVRGRWADLTGEWDFALGHADAAPDAVVFDRVIVVPFPPESAASGLAEQGSLHSVWYRRTVSAADLREAGWSSGRRLVLHFGAVDWEATVWVNGIQVATHRGGQSPFSADVTSALRPDGANVLVVHAVDHPEDVSILRGKQDWRDQPHAIWYHRTTGIWQPVWIEAVSETAITGLAWATDIPSAGVEVEIALSADPRPDSWLRVTIVHGGELLAESRTRALSRFETVRVRLPRQTNGQQYEELLWSPERPTLIDATVTLESPDGDGDAVASYFGIRSVEAADGAFLLNDRPTRLRAVLAQNYWPESHLAAPSPAALRREVELVLELGFNTARVHQKAEDPRFLYWADRLGLMLWAETASAYAFDRRAASNLISEWVSLVERDQSHPSVIAWVPLNESWGVQHIAHDPRQRALSRSVADLTRALDGTRPVISNDGWEHTCSDIWTIHDYEADPEVLAARYRDRASLEAMVAGFGPAGRRLSVDGAPAGSRPFMLTEFGGVSLASGKAEDWGYSTAATPAEFGERVCALIRAADQAAPLSGFCYTQLTDTGQETNGLLRADRTPKAPLAEIRSAVRGEPVPR